MEVEVWSKCGRKCRYKSFDHTLRRVSYNGLCYICGRCSIFQCVACACVHTRVRAHTLYNDMNFAGSIISWPPNFWIKNILYNFAGDNACVGSLSFYAYAPYQHTALSYLSTADDFAKNSVIRYVADTNIDNQPDFIVAKNEAIAYSASTASKPVALAFSHALTVVTKIA